MTRGEPKGPGLPGMAAPAGTKATTPPRRAPAAAVLLAALMILARSGPAQAARGGGELPDGLIAEIKFTGNKTISVEQIKGKVKSRVGRPLDRATVEDDMRALLATRWFSDVVPTFDPAPGGKGEFVLTFQVAEMPVLTEVKFIGLAEHFSLSHVKLKDIEEASGLIKGKRADATHARLAVAQIKTLYEEKGYEKAEVRLIEGGNPGDTRVVIEIFEGPKFKIDSIDFVGNTFVDDGVLKTKIESRRGFFAKLGAKRNKDGLESDKRALVKYYEDNGFFDVRVTAHDQARLRPRPGADHLHDLRGGPVQGPQGRLRGQQAPRRAQARKGLMLKPGMVFNETLRDLDYKTVNSRYWAIGCIDTKIDKDQHSHRPARPGRRRLQDRGRASPTSSAS